MIQRFSAHFIFPVSSSPVFGGIIEAEEDGTIKAIVRHETGLRELENMEFHSGILCPAFIDVFGIFSHSQIFEHFPVLKDFAFMMPSERRGEGAVLEWIKAIQFSGSRLTLEQLISVFTYEAAKAAGQQEKKGTLDVGKTPGITHVSHIDFPMLKVTDKSSVKRLI